ncbi:MAG: hypothetical protein IT521_11045 [Burkholderiales bacterium]|nr:hypothetical protein [Burkholderiales bacterium]
MKRNTIVNAAAALFIGAAPWLPSVANAGNNVAWSVSIGGPGFAVSAGQPAWGGPVIAGPVFGNRWIGGPGIGAALPVVPIAPRRVWVAAPPPMVVPAWRAPRVFVAAPVPVFRPRAVAWGPPVFVAPRPRPPVVLPVVHRTHWR